MIFFKCDKILDGFLNKLNGWWLLLVVNNIVICLVCWISVFIILYFNVEKLWNLLINILVFFIYWDWDSILMNCCKLFFVVINLLFICDFNCL